MPAMPLPPRMKASSAALRAAVAAASLGSSRKQPVVLSRNTRSYCFRFSVLMSAASYVVVAVHAPVLVPSASTVFAASGIEEWTQPAARASTSTLRGFWGFAGAVSGSAAIMRSTSLWQVVRGLLLRPPQPGCSGVCAAMIVEAARATSSAANIRPIDPPSKIRHQPTRSFDSVFPLDYLPERAEARTRPDRRGDAPGNARCPGAQDAGTGAGARAHHRARHRASFRRCSSGRAWLPLPGAAPARGPRLDHVLLGHLREQPARALLPADAERPQAARGADQSLG